MTTITKDQTSVRLVNAIDRTWSQIRKQHSDVPPVVITVGSGTSDPKDLKLGHFGYGRWHYDNTVVSELFIAGEGLQRGADKVLSTLLHEAAHGVATVRGVKDTSRQGRYHNTQFKTLAEEVGLTVEKLDTIGWSATTATNDTLRLYRRYVGVLERALVIWRNAEATTGSTRTSNNNGLTVFCQCPRRVRLSESVYTEGPILCGVCDHPFTADNDEAG